MKQNARKLNFLLVMPRLVQSVGDGYVFPLGVAYVSSSLKKAGFHVVTLNLNHREGDVFSILKDAITANRVDVVATGGLSPQYHLVRNVVESAKQIDNNIVTVMGGGIISADPETAMRALEFVDFGVIGEGEVTMCELARTLEEGGDPATVDGIIYMDGSGFRTTPRRKDIVDVDSIPWPDYEGFDLDKYLEVPPAEFAGVKGRRMVCMLGSRSCPFNCTFCFHTTGKKYRQRSIDDFFAELDYLISGHKIEYLSLADELFAPDLPRARDFCERIKKRGIRWYADFRADKIKPELLPVLKDSGLEVMFFGLESADNRILKSMRKGITIEQIESTLKQVYAAEIPIYGCFIFGDIEETNETAHNTLRWWREHSQYHIHLTLVKPFPGSHIYQYACKNGLIKDPIRYLRDGCPQINISKMNDTEFAAIVREISDITCVTNMLESVELLNLDARMGRESVSAACLSCGHRNVWNNIKLFAIDYIYCSHCGQKYGIPCPPEVRENLDRHVARLLATYGKVAIWGMTLPIIDLFKHSKLLRNPNVFPVDISASKQQMDLYGQSVYAPTILNEKQVPVVIIGVPSHGGQISCQIRQNHQHVRQIIDISRLVEAEELPMGSV